jgi:hypothetical protein
MNKFIPFLAILFSIPLTLFSLVDVRVGPLEVRTSDRAPLEAVVFDPGHPICFAVAHQMTLEVVTAETNEDKVTFTKKLFEPVLLGTDEDGDAVLIGKRSGDDELKALPLKDIEDFRLLENMRFGIDKETREQAHDMVEEVICD